MTRVLGPLVAEAARRFGDRPALVLHGDVPTTMTYAGWDAAADDLAGRFRAAGLGPGHLVAGVLPGGGEWLVAAVAADRVGAVWAPVSTALAPPERRALLEVVRPSSVVTAADAAVDGRGAAAVVRLAAGSAGRDAVVPDCDSPPRADRAGWSTVCFTSGTTGTPKGAVFTPDHQRAVQAVDLGPDAERTWDGGGHMIASTHLAHVGMALKLPWYVRRGATLHVLPRWRADDVLELVARHRITTLGVVAPQLALMLRSPLLDRLDLSCVQAVVAGGAASPPALVEEARRRLGAEYSIRWSSTESGGVGLGTAFGADDEEALHTVGRPRPGVEARVTDEADRPLPDGEVGELQLRSAAVMAGYVGDDDHGLDAAATAGALTSDGWLRTGDLARRLGSGCYVLAGRRSDAYVRGGYNVHPLEVEAVLGDHPGVADVAVAPRPDPVMGEVGVAVVVPADPRHPPSLASLRDHAADRVARHKLPEAVALVDHLPLTGAQKLDRAALAELAAGAAPASATSTTATPTTAGDADRPPTGEAP